MKRLTIVVYSNFGTYIKLTSYNKYFYTYLTKHNFDKLENRFYFTRVWSYLNWDLQNYKILLNFILLKHFCKAFANLRSWNLALCSLFRQNMKPDSVLHCGLLIWICNQLGQWIFWSKPDEDELSSGQTWGPGIDLMPLWSPFRPRPRPRPRRLHRSLTATCAGWQLRK